MKNYEIAEKVGFADPHYFGISFEKNDRLHTDRICKGET